MDSSWQMILSSEEFQKVMDVMENKLQQQFEQRFQEWTLQMTTQYDKFQQETSEALGKYAETLQKQRNDMFQLRRDLQETKKMLHNKMDRLSNDLRRDMKGRYPPPPPLGINITLSLIHISEPTRPY